MSESPSDPARHEDQERSSAITGDDVFAFGSEAEATDDTPTIISRTAPRPLPIDGMLSGSLRGWRLAHFELIEPIGVGGMAAVLRARDTQLDRFVALKILPPDMAQDAENVRRFHQEARSAAKLDHENIARVFFCGEDQRLHFIAFEFVEGENLRTILERRGRLPVAEVLHCVLQVAAGLAHAARRGVVHRDIKPSNIIVMPNGRAKLVDMGLARTLEPQNDRGLTQSGVTLGTFDYISPEQALEPREADVRSDIYSLGCTFYHMLTGQPPVPEGTAAKKLHHHQHIRPVDPRQLVPDLPDEVALILDRMMAKQARDRYQTPEHLVQHILVAARKLGLAPELPEGVLLVEADLPQPPGHRPLLLVALAAAAVVGLIFLLDQSPSPAPFAAHGHADVARDPGGTVTPAGQPAQPITPVKRPDPGDRGQVKPPAPAVAKIKVKSARELADWLKKNAAAPVKVIEVADTLDLDSLRKDDSTSPSLVIEGKSVTLKGTDPSHPPTIRLTYDARVVDRSSPWAALTLKSDYSHVKGLRFLVDGKGADVNIAALRLRGKESTVHNCRFDQARPPLSADAQMMMPLEEKRMPSGDDTRLASLVVESGRLELERCCFLGYRADLAGNEGVPVNAVLTGAETGGQDAVVCRGADSLSVRQCAFGPHETVFRLDGQKEENGLRVTLSHCTVMAGRHSTVFRFPGSGGADLHVQDSLFALGTHAEDGMDTGDGAALIRQEPRAGVSVSYQDQNNRYLLDTYWAGGAGASWDGFQALLRTSLREGASLTSRQLEKLPWVVKQPFGRLEADLDGRYRAFQVQAELGIAKDPGKGADGLVGVERLGSHSFVDILKTVLPATGRTLLVDPRHEEISEGVYPSLAQAVLAAKRGDTILLQHNGLMELAPITLNEAELTIRAQTGNHPVLAIKYSEKERVLFRLLSGKLVLENLEIQLTPPAEVKNESLVSLAGDGECICKGCVITLAGKTSEKHRSVALLPGSDTVMATNKPRARTPDQGPRLELNGCFVRGEGDLVWSPASCPCEVEVRNTLAALTGSLLNVESGRQAAAGAAQKVQLKLERVTTCLKAPLLRLGREGETRALLPIRCEANNCLFMPFAENGCLIHVAVAQESDASNDRLKERLIWSGSENAYGKFANWIEQQWGESLMEHDLTKWQTFTNVREKYKVSFDLLPSDSLTRILPGQFQPSPRLQDCGAPDNVPLPYKPER